MRDVDTLNSALMIKGSELVALPLNSFFINKIGDIHRIAAVGRENYVTELDLLAYGCSYTCDKLESVRCMKSHSLVHE